MSPSLAAAKPARKRKNPFADADRLAELPEVVGVEYVMRRLGKSRAGVYLMVREGRIGGVVRTGRNVRFDRERFDRWYLETCVTPYEPEQAA